MRQHLALTSLLVRDYDEAIAFFTGKLDFEVLEDAPSRRSDPPHEPKRWVVVAPPGARECAILLARAETPEQVSRIGNQTGGRVFLFLHTDDFWRDYERYRARGVRFVRGEPRAETYGTIAVFLDVSGNMWDLIGPPRIDGTIGTGGAE